MKNKGNFKNVVWCLMLSGILCLSGCTYSSYPYSNSDNAYRQLESQLDNLSTQGASKKFVIDNAHAFQAKSNRLSPGMIEFLNKVIQSLKSSPTTKIKIVGFTDSRGSPKKNQLISLKRAMMVADYFRNHGVSSSRISFAAGGSLHPVASNATETGRSQNRRIEITFYD